MNLQQAVHNYRQRNPECTAEMLGAFLEGWTAREVVIDAFTLKERAKQHIKENYSMYDFRELLERVYIDGANNL